MSPLFGGRRRRERMAWRGGRKSKVWGGGRGGWEMGAVGGLEPGVVAVGMVEMV